MGNSFIEHTLQSVACQTTPDFEIEHIVFEGASTADTVEITRGFSPAVRWELKKTNGKPMLSIKTSASRMAKSLGG